MAAALRFGRRNFGLTAPNPCVAALIVSDGVVVGRGVTAPGGRPHAEVVALAEAGEAARGATIYVTLEPCSHTARRRLAPRRSSPPGVARVVAALEDPDARVAGRGLALLREAGIAVAVGVGDEQARRDHLGHILRVTAGRPMVTLKLALTADGYAAGDEHDARLAITGEAANLAVQVMRSLHDAIMIGVGTAREDDPLLTVRLPGVTRSRCGSCSTRVSTAASFAARRDGARIPDAGGRDGASPARARGGARPGRRRSRAGRSGRARQGQSRRGAAAARRARRDPRLQRGRPTRRLGLVEGGLADEVALFTALKPLGRPGRPALAAAARSALADPARYREARGAVYGDDRLRMGADRVTRSDCRASRRSLTEPSS